MKSVLWSVMFLFSLVFLLFAYYITSPKIRSVIDPRAPWIHAYLGPYTRGKDLSPPVVVVAPPAPEASEVPAATPAPVVAAPVAPEPEVFDLKKLAANRAAWPAKVKITKATEFPAVVNNKVVGKLVAPIGAEVGLVTISGGKLGVEYQGGGAWLFVEDTDLEARTMKKP